jgi:DNA polymerase III epsilon subunit-like protein
MIDIETLGTKPGCVVLSIGAVEFDDNTTGKEFEVNINPESCVAHGLTIEARTVMWWLEQDEAARNILTQQVGKSLDVALVSLCNAFDWKGKKVWCNGVSFDVPILEAALTSIGLPSPWKFWDVMDFRTLKNLLPKSTLNELQAPNDLKHGALSDAKAQAMTTINILKHLRGE